MKPKFLSGIGALFAALLIAGTLFVPAASAQSYESMEVITTDEATLSLIDELWGTDITIGEYLEKVHPEFLTDMSDDEKADVYQRKMPWSATDLESTHARAAPSVVVHAVISKDYPFIEFGGNAQFYGDDDPSYLYVEAFLRNGADQTAGSTSRSVRNATYVEATNMVAYPEDDDYRVYAWGYALPSNVEDQEWTGWVTYP
ncbi:hypothetical protein [Methanoculleus sp. MH98A]|uniref:hypothetical protein n=1 Tax=Methanoculleus sp. MH98A TaxID=1495314 RepID=UPI0004A1955B|nr:hypothetical protein [Methanoculleus sp. MH98A]KDE54567.1 hypothetical protein EI28_13385 [Methanoculleus sp. MH98A]